MKVASIQQDKTEYYVHSDVVKGMILDCFLHHKLKLIRNWGSADETDQLCFKDVTLIQFVTRTTNFQIVIRPKEGRVMLMHTTKRGRKLFLYFLQKLQKMIDNTYLPNF